MAAEPRLSRACAGPGGENHLVPPRRFRCAAPLLPLPFVVLARPAPAQVLAPGDNLVVDGIPPIPAALAEQVERYTEFRAATLLDWHPTRREMLDPHALRPTAQVHRVKMPGGARTQLDVLPREGERRPLPPGRRRELRLRPDVGGNELLPDVPLRPRDRRRDAADRRQVAEQSGRVVAVGGRSWRTPAPAATARTPTCTSIDPADPKSDAKVAELGGGWGVLDWSPGDGTILVGEYVSINESYLWLVDVKTGAQDGADAARRRRRPRTPAEASPRTASTCGRTTDRGSEFQRLASIDVADEGGHTYLSDRSPIGTSRSSSSRRTASDRVRRPTRPASARLRDRLAPGAGPVGPSCPPGGLRPEVPPEGPARWASTCTSASTADATLFPRPRHGQARALDRERDRRARPRERSPSRELVRWKTLRRPRDLAASSTARRRSVPRQAARSSSTSTAAPRGSSGRASWARDNYFINELGVAVLFPNVRGSAGYGKTFLKLDNGLLREDSVQGHRRPARLDRRPARPRRRPRHGHRRQLRRLHDAGDRHATTATASAARIDVVGISNFVTFLEHTEAYRRDLRRAEYGDERDPEDARVPGADRAAEQRRRRSRKPLFVVAGHERPARAG